MFAALDKKNKGKLLWRSKDVKEPCTLFLAYHGHHRRSEAVHRGL